jgi:hypothetical protein
MRVPPWMVLLVAVLWGSSASRVHAGTNVWTSNGPGGGPIQVLAIDPVTPTTLYAGTDTNGVFKSTDGGRSWSAVNAGLPFHPPDSFLHHITLAIDPNTPTTFYAWVGNRGVYKSTDGGSSWSAANTGLTNAIIGVLALDPITPTTLLCGGPRLVLVPHIQKHRRRQELECNECRPAPRSPPQRCHRPGD